MNWTHCALCLETVVSRGFNRSDHLGCEILLCHINQHSISDLFWLSGYCKTAFQVLGIHPVTSKVAPSKTKLHLGDLLAQIFTPIRKFWIVPPYSMIRVTLRRKFLTVPYQSWACSSVSMNLCFVSEDCADFSGLPSISTAWQIGIGPNPQWQCSPDPSHQPI